MHKLQLGQYKGLKIDSAPMYTENDLDLGVMESTIKLLNQWAKNSRPAELGDEVVVTLQAECDGMFVPELSKNNFKYSVGDPAMLEQFTQALSKKAGESFQMEIPFPENAPIERVSGKTVTFNVTIQELFPARQIAITDEIARQIDPQVSGIDQFQHKLRQFISDNWQQMIAEANLRSTLDTIIANSVYELDEEELNKVFEDIVKETQEKMFSASDPQLLESLLSKNDEYFYDDCRILAEKTIVEDLVIREIINQEKISISPEEFEEGKRKFIEYASDNDTFTRLFPSDSSFYEHLLREKTLHLLLQWNLKQTEH